MFGLVDCNNFFVSCERVFRPELIGRPVIVLSNNDGCSVALSNEAKALGFKRGDPYFKIKAECERYGVIVFSGNHRLYGDMSRRVMATLASLSDGLEVYSVDEAFIRMDPRLGPLDEYGRYVVEHVRKCTGIPVSLGIARTKTLAKLASRFAKKYPGYRGACLLDTPDKERKALELTAVGDVWGVGRRTLARFDRIGIHTALDFASLSQDVIKGMFSVVGQRTWQELNGVSCIPYEVTAPDKKTMTSSRSFAADIHDWEPLRQAVCTFAAILGRKLRAQRSHALELSVFVATNRFHEHDPQYWNMAAVRLPRPTADTPMLAKAATEALRKVYRPGYGIKKAGVTINKLSGPEGYQAGLFDDQSDMERRARLMAVMDSINASPGMADTVRIASMGDGVDPLLRREHASHLYTTRLDDIIEVHT